VAYGADQSYPVAPFSLPIRQFHMVGSYTHFDQRVAQHVVAKPARPSLLRRAAEAASVTFTTAAGTFSLGGYLDRHPATGLLIARGDTILFEHYRYARTDADRFLSQSMAKTVTAMLIGIAVEEGRIRSIDQLAADYVPALAGSEYGRTSIRDLLHMASGVAFVETYDGNDDSARMGRLLFARTNTSSAAVVASFNTREAPPGTRFHYAGAETEVLGLVLRQAVGMPLASYLEDRIWRKLGAEADASWTIDTTGQETAHCCLSVTLRDWARFALMLAHDGAWNGQQIVPRQWVLDATTVAAPWLAPGVASKFYGYGYQLWLLPGDRRQFALLGIHGQAIFVDPGAQLVMVHTAVRVKPTGDPIAGEVVALWRAVVKRYGG
jgi:CubicO group peptidase (beta-lactamase class C family)